MAATSEAQKVKYRHYLGFSPTFKQADPRLENAALSICAIADGGSQPDNSSQLAMFVILGQLDEVEKRLRELWVQQQVVGQGNVKLDVARGTAMLSSEGRRLVNGLAALLSTSPRRDIFGPATINAEGDAFYDTPGASGTGQSW